MRGMPDGPGWVIHAEDPAGSGLTACTGLAFELPPDGLPKTERLVQCTGCANADQPRQAREAERKRWAEWVVAGLQYPIDMRVEPIPDDDMLEAIAQAWFVDPQGGWDDIESVREVVWEEATNATRLPPETP